MKNTTSPNKKTGRLIVKNLIFLSVLIVVSALSIWAWFTNGSSATANGISVKAKAGGVKVSWEENGTYYDNLTALTEAEANEDKSGGTGLAKSLLDTDGNSAVLKLITGNGLNFFEPYLNRRTGTVLTNSDGTWQGYNIEEGAGKYIDIDLYFKGDDAKDIYLESDSLVSPKDISLRISDYGDFSKDYICAASRVAFLNAEKTKCSFIWAPNSNYKLEETENGYTRVEEVKTGTSGGGTIGGLNGGAEKDGKDYYLWTIDTTKDYNGGDQRQITESYKFEYNASIKYYVAKFKVIVPTYQADNPSIPFLVSESGTSPLTNTVTIDKSASFNGNDSGSLLKISNKTYNAATYNNQLIDANLCCQFYITKTNTLIQGTSVEVEFGFNPQTGVMTVLSYNGNDSWSKGDTSGPVETKYYEVDDAINTVLVAPENSVALSAGDDLGKSVIFKNSDKRNVLPVSIKLTEQFTVTKTGTEAQATYTFKNKSTGKSLNVTNGKVSFTNTATSFFLSYVEGFEGPALRVGDYYLVAQNGEIKAVTSSELESKYLVTVYTGSSYAFYDNSAQELYQYYNGTALSTLDTNTEPPLYATTAYKDDDTVTEVGEKIATLTKKENSDDYTAHIVIRVWVEGTDRDALTPLADGIFNLSLHFTSKTAS